MLYIKRSFTFGIGKIDIVVILYLLYSTLQIIVSAGKNTEPETYIKLLLIAELYMIGRNIPKELICSLIVVLSASAIIALLCKWFLNTGQSGAFIAIGFTGLIAVVFNKDYKKGIIMYGVLLTLLSAGIIITFSRAAILAILSAVLYLFSQSDYFKRVKPITKVFTVVSIATLAVVATYFLYTVRPESANVRLLLWRVCGENILKQPFFGYSIGSLQSLYMYWQAEYFKLHPNSFFVPFATNHFQSFNEILHILCEQGFIGFLFIAYIVGRVLVRKASKEYYPIKSSLIALLIVSCFLYTSDILPISMLFPLFVGILSSAEQPISFLNNKTNYHNEISSSVIVKCLLSAVCIIAIIFSVKIYYRYDNVSKNLTEYIREDNKRSITNNDESLILRNREMSLAYASYSYKEADTNKQIEILKKVSKKIPTSDIFLKLGELQLQDNCLEEAKRCYLLSYHMVPDRILPKYHLFNYYKETNNTDKAKEWAQIILESNPRIYNAVTLEIKHYAKEYLKGL